MKQSNKSNKIKILIIMLIIIIGIIMVAIKGFNFDLKYKNTQSIELHLQTQFNISDIKNITNEVLGKQKVMIQKVEVYEESVLITSTSISDEQKNDIITKINEKYGLELKAEDTTIENVAHTKGRDIIKPYMVQFIIATIVTLVYMGIRYYKLNAIKSIARTLGTLMIAQIVLFSIIAITRIPIGRLTIPMVIIVYLTTLYIMASKLEQELKENKIQETENK
ncbi:MAG: hypothetical protein ACLS90_03505 [Clostridia bacterium]